MSTEGPTPEELQRAGELEKVSKELKSEFNRSREHETQAINELEKILWLSNSGAATVTIGYITTATSATTMQFLGCSVFVLAIVLLLTMKLIGEFNASRDRVRRKNASERFFIENLPISVLEGIRDPLFMRLAKTYKALQLGAAFLFITGCLFTLVGVYPQSWVSESPTPPPLR